MTGQDDDLYQRMLFFQPPKELLSVHSGHLEIDERKIQLVAVRLFQCLKSIRGGHDLEIADLESSC